MGAASDRGVRAWLARWRHSRGFGVHSPLAYRLVREVVRPDSRYGYYGYHAISRALRGVVDHEGELEGRARLLLRVCATLRPGSVSLPPHAPRCLRAAVAAAEPRALLTTEPAKARLAVEWTQGRTPDVIARHMAAPGAMLLCFGHVGPVAEMLPGVMAEGLVLHSHTVLLAVQRDRMPLVVHTVNFS